MNEGDFLENHLLKEYSCVYMYVYPAKIEIYSPSNIKEKRSIYNMVVDIPWYVWRAMQSRLLIQLHICLLLPALQVAVAHANAPVIAKPGCRDTCGSVRIPYPFGIGAGCFLDHWFEIDCRPSPTSSNASMPTPFLSSFNLEVIKATEVIFGYDSQSLTVGIPPRNSCAAETQPRQQDSINLTGSPFIFSAIDNVFMMEGCPGSAVVFDERNYTVAGCAAVCESNIAIPPNSCYGVHCCQTPLSNIGFPTFYQIDFTHHASNANQSCLVATVISSDSVNQYAGRFFSSDPPSAVPVFLSWSWKSNLPADNDSRAFCGRDLSDFHNYFYCRCKGHNYYGNPYVSNGCQVPEGCKGCRGYCRPQYVGYGHYNTDVYYCDKYPQLASILGLSISFGVVLLVLGLYGLYRFIKRRREMKRRAKFFKRNGGLLLQQQLSSDEGVLEKTKIFTIIELDKATDHFNENRILGQGGQGTVYKGMLLDGRIVAIKKSKLLDESQLEQFINEVVILSQINHRNVVKLLGCCLETEVPLLVYEFIPNGTLSQHIHDPDEDFVISWEMRLKIAADSAAAVAYLHSSSSIPIYHRDIKSSNILLDEKHRAKVSDFGSSKTIAIDQTHLTTLVQGTMGYLDPEYFQSYQFTEKSDVYSFGVVLLEILTGKNPIYRDASTMEQKNLVTEFLFLIENSGLSNILDPKIANQAKEEQLIAIVELAKCCISWSGKLRPTMKEVAMALEMIMKSPDQASTCYQQAFPVPDEGFAENTMTGAEFISNPLPVWAGSPLYTDV